MFYLYAILIILLLPFIFCLFLSRNYNYWRKRNIPFLRPTPCFGHMAVVLFQQRSIGERIAELHRSTNEPFVGIFTLDEPGLLVRDRELVRKILVKDFNYFMDRSFAPSEELEPILGQALFGMKGEKWRYLRALLTPSFTTGRMRNMFNLVRGQTVQLDQLIERSLANSATVDVKGMFARFATDVISLCAFGMDVKSMENPNSPVLEIGRKTFVKTACESFILSLMFMAPWILKLFRLKLAPDSFYDVLRTAIWSNIEYRQQNNVNRDDFLDLLIEVRQQTLLENESQSSSLVLDGDVLIAQAFGYLVAGFETSSITTSLTLYQLALHPDIQDRARQEICEILGKYNGQLTYDGLKEMIYLRQCMNETLRMYPTLLFLDRICTKDYQIPDTQLIIEKGTRVFMSVSELQMDPDIYSDPSKFDPDRFAGDKINDYKLNYYPFGDGPRMCIGTRFGIMQTLAGLVTLLRKYRVELCKTTPIPIRFDPRAFNLTVRNGLPLKLVQCD